MQFSSKEKGMFSIELRVLNSSFFHSLFSRQIKRIELILKKSTVPSGTGPLMCNNDELKLYFYLKITCILQYRTYIKP